MNIPRTSVGDSVPFYLNDRNLQDRYRMWTNSKTIAYNYGAGASLRYTFPANYTLATNVTFARLQRRSQNDGLEDGFNTPRWMINVSAGNANVYRNIGLMITYRWQASYYWQSFLVNSTTPAFQTVDAQLTKKFKSLGLKVGGSNIFNHYYHSFLGGPAVGGFYYTSLTYNL